MIDFTLTNRQQQIREAIHGLAVSVIRPECLKWDREHGIPHDFLRNLAMLASNLGSLAMMDRSTENKEAGAPRDAK